MKRITLLIFFVLAMPVWAMAPHPTPNVPAQATAPVAPAAPLPPPAAAAPAPATTAATTPTPPAPSSTATTSATNGVQVADLYQFAQNTIMHVYNYDYQNYADKFKDAEPLFTKDGWEAFQKALTASKNIEGVQKHKLSLVAKITGESQLVNEETRNEEKVWTVKTPVEVLYTNPDKIQLTQQLEISVSIIKDPNKAGQLAAVEFVAQPAKSNG